MVAGNRFSERSARYTLTYPLPQTAVFERLGVQNYFMWDRASLVPRWVFAAFMDSLAVDAELVPVGGGLAVLEMRCTHRTPTG